MHRQRSRLSEGCRSNRRSPLVPITPRVQHRNTLSRYKKRLSSSTISGLPPLRQIAGYCQPHSSKVTWTPSPDQNYRRWTNGRRTRRRQLGRGSARLQGSAAIFQVGPQSSVLMTLEGPELDHRVTTDWYSRRFSHEIQQFI